MKICIVGHTGFVGCTIFQHLIEAGYIVEGINSQSPQIDRVCDLVINCAGNSKKYLAEKDKEFVHLIEEGVLDRLRRIRAKRIIHISSISVEDDSNYGASKRFVEEEIKLIFSDVCFLRLGCLIGKGLSKNVVYDLLNENPIWVTLDSTFNFIHMDEVVKLVEHLVEHPQSREIINVAASNSISVKKIAEVMKVVPQVRENAEVIYTQIGTEKLQAFFETKDSKYYITQYLKN